MAIISNATTIADAGAFSVSLGSIVHIKTLTASSSGTLSFVHGTDGVVLDSTYPIYKFEFINIHPATNNTIFQFQCSTNSGSSYGVTATTTAFQAYIDPSNSSTSLSYVASYDLAQSSSYVYLAPTVKRSGGSSSCCAGSLQLFNPSSATYVKHFMARCVKDADGTDEFVELHTAGYMNTTSAVNAISFKFSSGNIDDGKIKLYGIKDS